MSPCDRIVPPSAPKARIARFVAPGLPRHITQHGKTANFTTISSPCNAATMMAAARHVALNPVRARVAACPWDWRWSGVRAHLAARDDALRPSRLLERCNFLCLASDEAIAARRENDRPPARIACLSG